MTDDEWRALERQGAIRAATEMYLGTTETSVRKDALRKLQRLNAPIPNLEEHHMAGLVVDVSGVQKKGKQLVGQATLHTTDEIDPATGEKRPPKILPAVTLTGRFHHPDPEPQSLPSAGRGAVVAPKPTSRFADWETAALLGEAQKLGYEEKPFPNNGVRRMRLINFLKTRLP